MKQSELSLFEKLHLVLLVTINEVTGDTIYRLVNQSSRIRSAGNKYHQHEESLANVPQMCASNLKPIVKREIDFTYYIQRSG